MPQRDYDTILECLTAANGLIIVYAGNKN